MEADQSTLQLLPRRGYGTPVHLPASQRKKVLTNFYEINLGGKESVIYQFVIDTEPSIPSDSK